MSLRAPRKTGPEGILLLDKPVGPTSAQVLRKIAAHFHIRGLGHSGTLDPLASGLLVICLGHATRVMPWLTQGRKRYLAGVTFGKATDSGDLAGAELETAEPPADLEARVGQALQAFRGKVMQVPPVFSAKKVGGRRLYELARAGELEDVVPAAVEVEFYSTELTGSAGHTFNFDIACSPGTYIRAFARDLGAAVGCPAVLSSLVRTETGGFRLHEAHSLEAILAAASPFDLLLPVSRAFPDAPVRDCSEAEVTTLLSGSGIFLADAEALSLAGRLCLLSTSSHGLDGVFALGRLDETGRLRMARLLGSADRTPADGR